MFYKSKEQSDSQEVIGMNIGKNICALRKKYNLTQEDVANHLGVSPQAVSKWENENSCPDIALLPDIADLFKVTVDDLMRKGDTEVVVGKADEKQTENNTQSFAVSAKKKLCIITTNPNGRQNKVNVPLSLVKTGLRIGNRFGLQEDISQKLNEIIATENLDEILTVDGEHGETVEIRFE